MNWHWTRSKTGCLIGGISALVIASGLELGVWRSLEQTAYTQLFRLRGSTDWSSQVVVIGIDDTSLSALGQYPWSRDVYAQLMEQMLPAAPSAVVFDIVFADDSPADEALALAFAEQSQVVLAQGWDTQNQLIAVTPALAEVAVATGHIQKQEDTDRITRQIKPVIQGVPALGLAAVAVYALVTDSTATQNIEFAASKDLLINWPGPSQQVPHYSFVSVMAGEVSTKAFTDKIVLIGATATGLDQNLTTPFDLDPPTNGVYLHAATIDNLLQQRFLWQLPDSAVVVMLLLGGPSLGWIVARFQPRMQVVIGMTIAGGIAVTGLVALCKSYWLPTAWPIGLVGLTIGGCITEHYYHEKKQLHLAVDHLQDSYSKPRIGKTAVALGDNAISSASTSGNLFPTSSGVATSLLTITEQVSQLIWQDELTRVGNRRSFDRVLDQAWQQAIEQKQTLAVFLCDIDFFKQFNDTYGHLAGDRCLHQVASAIRAAITPADGFVARYGGEEFGIVLHNTDIERARHLAKSICSSVESLGIDHVASTASKYVTLSIGAAVESPQHSSLLRTIVTTADKALYKAKLTGRNQARVIDNNTYGPLVELTHM